MTFYEIVLTKRIIEEFWILGICKRQVALLVKELRGGFKVENLRSRWVRKGDFARV